VCKNIALATLPTDVAQPGTALEVEVLGERLAATVVAMPF
jgi:glycine cleavage system aminomethyltransferase T